MWNLRGPNSDPVLLRDHDGFQSISFSTDGEALASFTSFDLAALRNLNRRGAVPQYTEAEPAALRRWDLHTAAIRYGLEMPKEPSAYGSGGAYRAFQGLESTRFGSGKTTASCGFGIFYSVTACHWSFEDPGWNRP